MRNEYGQLMIPDHLLGKAAFGQVTERRPAISPGNEHDLFVFPDPGGEKLDCLEMQFRESHAFKMQFAIMAQFIDIGDAIRAFILYVDYIGGQFRILGEQIAELLHGKYAFLAAVVGDEEMITLAETLRDDYQ